MCRQLKSNPIIITSSVTQDELRHWILDGETALAIACEMIWSYPQGQRSKHLEIQLKGCLLTALRHNNRRILDIRNPPNELHAPLTFPDSRTQELCGPSAEFNTYEGQYTRHYAALLPYQHTETRAVHEPFW